MLNMYLITGFSFFLVFIMCGRPVRMSSKFMNTLKSKVTRKRKKIAQKCVFCSELEVPLFDDIVPVFVSVLLY